MSFGPSKHLSDFLSTYFEFEPNQLNLGVWRGKINMHNLLFKKAAFDPLLKKCKSKPDISIHDFMSKAHLVDENASDCSFLDLKLVSGNIGHLDVKVPWQSLLVGGSEKVEVVLKDVVIRLAVESSMSSELQKRGNALRGIYKESTPNDENFHSILERKWKEKMIEIAMKCLEDGKDIPSPQEFEKLKVKFIEEEKNCEEDTVIGEHRSFMERFVGSFASTLGWRVGKDLKLSLENLKIVMVQDNVEVGLHVSRIVIGEDVIEDADASEDFSSVTTSQNSKISEEKHHAVSDTMNKCLMISKIGFFVKESKSYVGYNSVPDAKEFIFKPTNAKMNMCLRRTGDKVKVEIDNEESDMNFRNNYEDDKMESEEERKEEEPRLQRRGKREKRRRNDGSNNNAVENVNGKDEDIPDAKKRSFISPSKEDRDISQKSGMLNQVHSSPPYVQADSFVGIQEFSNVSALFSLQVQVESVHVVATLHTMQLCQRFLNRVKSIERGRPRGSLAENPMGSEQRKIFLRQMMHYTVLQVLKDFRKKRLVQNYFARGGEPGRPSYSDEYIKLLERIKNDEKMTSPTEYEQSVAMTYRQKMKRLEGWLSVEQVVLYRKQYQNEISNKRINSFKSFSPVQRSPSAQKSTPTKRHRHRPSRIFQSGSITTSQIPKHQKHKTLNVETMNEVLDLIPSERHSVYVVDEENPSLLQDRLLIPSMPDVEQLERMTSGRALVTTQQYSDPLFDAPTNLSVSSSISVTVSSLHMNLYENVGTSGKIVEDGYNENHLLISCIISRLLFLDTKSNDRIQTFSISSFLLRSKDSTLLHSGNFTNMYESCDSFCIESTMSSDSFGSSSPFLVGKITNRLEKYGQECKQKIRLRFAKVQCWFDYGTCVNVMDFFGILRKHACGDFANPSNFDKMRFVASKSLRKPISTQSAHDLVVQCGGFDLHFTVGPEKESSVLCTIGNLEYKQGYLISRCDTQVEQVFLMQAIQVTSEDLTLTKDPVDINIALNSCTKSFNPSSMTIFVSPISILLSPRLSEILGQIYSTYQINHQQKQARSLSTIPVLRLAVCSNQIKMKAQIHIKSFTLKVLREEPIFEYQGDIPVRMQKIALAEIFIDFLSTLVCFQSPYTNPASVEALQIARDRIHAVGVPSESIKDSLDFITSSLVERLAEMEARGRWTKEVAESIGLSHLHYNLSDDEIKNHDDMYSSIDELIKRTAFDTVEYIQKISPIEKEQWSSSIILDITSGLTLDLDSYSYDNVVSGSISSISLRNGGGRNLFSLDGTPSLFQRDKIYGLEGCHSCKGLLFEATQCKSGSKVGQGGLKFSDIASDKRIQIYFCDSTPIQTFSRYVKLSIGSALLNFNDLDYSNILENIEQISQSFHSWHKYDEFPFFKEAESAEADTRSLAISMDFDHFALCLNTDEFQPFFKICLQKLSIDTISNTELRNQLKMMELIATSKNILIYDLTPEGQIYDEVVVPQQNPKDIDNLFELRMTFSSDTKQAPSELLLVCRGIRLVFLRRFLNEIFQYFLSPNYGFGHFMSINFGTSSFDGGSREVTHPISYQIFLMDSSIMCPISSSSEELIGFKAERVIMTNSYVEKSFDPPVFDEEEAFSNSKEDFEESCGDILFTGSYTDSVIFHNGSFDPLPFDPKSLLRVTVSAENVRIFTALADQKNVDDVESNAKDISLIKPYIELSTAIESGSSVYKTTSNLPEHLFMQKKRLSSLSERLWEEISEEPVQMEIVADMGPAKMRILFKDHVSFDEDFEGRSQGFTVNMRTSQIYALMSIWYGNMQELPILFPYTSEVIVAAIEVPPCPQSWPEYGTPEFQQRMSAPSTKTLELFFAVSRLSWDCSFDDSDYFSKTFNCAYMIRAIKDKVNLELTNMLLNVDFDSQHFMRVGLSASAFLITQHRPTFTSFSIPFHAKEQVPKRKTFIDMEWGLFKDSFDLTSNQDTSFQLTCFMTPDRNCLVNIGISGLEAISSNLAFFWIVMEYFSAYFLYPEYGNPYFTAEDKRNHYLEQLNKSTHGDISFDCLNLDVRLWLASPTIVLPSDPFKSNCSKLVLRSGTGGISYRYRTIDVGFSSQHVLTKNMELFFHFDNPSLESLKHTKKSDNDVQILASGLNLNILYDFHIETNHMNISFSTISRENCTNVEAGIEVGLGHVDPMCLPPSSVCNPRKTLVKNSDNLVCEIILSPEYLKHAAGLATAFIGPYEPDSEQTSNGNTQSQGTFSVTTRLESVQMLICEPTLRLHLPIAKIFLSEFYLSISDLQIHQLKKDDSEQFQACADASLWIDYYKNGPARCWEPFLEPYKFTTLYEKSSERGNGFTLNSLYPLHMNISDAFLETLHVATGSLYESMFRVFEKQEATVTPPPSSQDSTSMLNGSPRVQHESIVRSIIPGEHTPLHISHEHPKLLSSNERVAFSVLNSCGHRIRYHTQTTSDQDVTISYLDHMEMASLSFLPTISVFRNLKVAELSWEDSNNDMSSSKENLDSSHFIDIQIPGMMWCRGICIDQTGKKFEQLMPRSKVLQNKLRRDWRLQNVLSLLTEVSTSEGGRRLSVNSPFELVNNTCHEIQLAYHYEDKYFEKKLAEDGREFEEKIDDSECHVINIEAGKSFHVPMPLIEASLHEFGTDLGFIWIRPSDKLAEYSSRPINLFSLVKESDDLFQKDSMSSETEYNLFCPVNSDDIEMKSPYCYCIEVKRSPLVTRFPGHGINPNRDTLHEQKISASGFESTIAEDKTLGDSMRKEKGQKKKQNLDEDASHGPVAYTLVIHPPIVIENLLPETAMYTLIDPSREKEVWFQILSPGESVPIYSVGLDSPLVLSINIGYCRTPPNEAVLVHQGLDIMRQIKEEDIHKSGRTSILDEEIMYELKDTDQGNYSFAPVARTISVVDSENQRLELNIDNQRGSGGQRHIVVSCPYWIVNTTEHPLSYKQEKSAQMVSGSISSPQNDGSRRIDHGRRNLFYDPLRSKTIFPGKRGALFHMKQNLDVDKYTSLLGNDISLEDLAELAFMFNYRNVNRLVGTDRLSLQLVDPQWRALRSSEWSRGFSLDSVGVTQIVSMHCMDGKQLEVAAIVTVAPGGLSKYTKIVRIYPRYVLINQLSRSIRLWQDSSLVHPSIVLDSSKDVSRSTGSHNWKIQRSEERQTTTDNERELYQYDFLFGQPSILDYQPRIQIQHKTIAHKSAFYITTAPPQEPIPFHLPDTRADRELRIDFGPNWNLSPSFPADVIGEYTLKMSRVVDLRTLEHVDHRGVEQYSVEISPQSISDEDGLLEQWDGDLGIWFETMQWDGMTKIIVKGLKHGSISTLKLSEIHIGDELLSVNGVSAQELGFAESMKLMKEKLQQVALIAQKKKKSLNQRIGLTVKKSKFRKKQDDFSRLSNADQSSPEDKHVLNLEFQTLEFRMDKIRDRALRRKKYANKSLRKSRALSNRHLNDSPIRNSNSNNLEEHEDQKLKASENLLQVSMKVINQSLFVFVREKKGGAPYRIENRSLKHFIYFRQRSCNAHPWISLAPGDSCNYTWEEPLKPDKLLVKVSKESTKDKFGKDHKKLLFKTVDSEDKGGFGPIGTMKLDVVGSQAMFACPKNANDDEHFLHGIIDTDGATRVMIISDFKALNSEENLQGLKVHQTLLESEIESEVQYLRKLKEKKSQIPHSNSQLPTVQEDSDVTTSVHSASEIDLPVNIEYEEDTITKQNQVLVEVIEACGLQTSYNSALTGLCSPYCSIRIEQRTKTLRKNLFSKKPKGKKTYYVERSTNPKWSGMKFVFDLPKAAQTNPNSFSLLIKVKDYKNIGNGKPLGRVEINLDTLKDQKEVFGWFPLLLRSGRGTDLTNPAAAGHVQGSIRLRLRWIWDSRALINYFIMLSEHRLTKLRSNSESTKLYHDKLQAERRKKEELDSLFFSRIPQLNSRMKRILPPKLKLTSTHVKPVFSAMKGTRSKLRQLWKRHDADGLPSVPVRSYDENKFSKVPSMRMLDTALESTDGSTTVSMRMSKDNIFFPPQRGIAYSEGNILLHSDTPPIYDENESLQADTFASQDQKYRDTLLMLDVICRQSEEAYYQKHFHMMPMILGDISNTIQAQSGALNSWVLAYAVVNDKNLKPFFIEEHGIDDHIEKQSLPIRKISMVQSIYPVLQLPARAPTLLQEKNQNFQRKLKISRDYFEKTAKRSLMAVLNPGGWLHLRPITALNLPEIKEKYSKMLVKIQYGSKTCSTTKVDAGFSPVWVKESEIFLNVDTILTPKPSFFETRDNDLAVAVEPLKTSGTLKLTVMGIRMKSKVELGVLQIPLANAIGCCNEATEESNIVVNGAKQGIYTKWFPLNDPRDCIEGEHQMSLRSTETEKVSDNDFFAQTPCIKLAMWWIPDKENNSIPVQGPDKLNESTRKMTERYFCATLDGISSSLSDSYGAKEILSFNFTDTDLRYSHTESTTQLGAAVGRIQIDHHADNALEPVILSPHPVADPQPTIQILAIKDNIRSKSNLDSFKHIAVALEEMDLRIEEACMFHVWELFYRILRRQNSRKASMLFASSSYFYFDKKISKFAKSFADYLLPSTQNEVLHSMISTNEDEIASKARQIYIRNLMLAAVKINVSYIKSSRFHNSVVTRTKFSNQITIQGVRDSTNDNVLANQRRDIEAFRAWCELGHENEWSILKLDQRTKNFQNVISAAVPAITGAPVKVNGKVIDNIFATWSEIINNLKSFYTKEMIFQIHKILGSVDFFGNPTMAVNSIMKGAHDFVVLPFREFLRSPNDPSKLGIGVAKGTISLLSHFFSGVFGFVSNISGAGGNAAAALSFDEKFKEWHKQQVVEHFRHMHGDFRPKGCELVISTVKRPLEDVIAGLLFAVSGIFVEPMKGAEIGGFAGFTKGIGIGTVGLVAKPLVGVFDAFAHVSDSFHDVARSVNILDKRETTVKSMRLPYVFGLHKTLLPFNPVEAKCADLLRRFPLKEDKKENSNEGEHLVVSQLLKKGPGLGCYLIVTTKRVMKFTVKFDVATLPTIDWEVRFDDDNHIVSSVEHEMHETFILKIKRIPRNPVSPTKTITSPEETKPNHNVFLRNALEVGENTSLMDHESVKMKKVGPFGGNRAKKKERIAYCKATLDQKDPLIIIHNAICCLTDNFDSIMRRNHFYNPTSSEGQTAFGPLYFTNTDTEILNSKNREDFDYLDNIPWIYNFTASHFSGNQEEWTFEDELESIRQSMTAPLWILEAQAHSTYLAEEESVEELAVPPDSEHYPELRNLSYNNFNLGLNNQSDNPPSINNPLSQHIENPLAGEVATTDPTLVDIPSNKDTNVEERFNRLEDMITKLIESNKEAITNDIAPISDGLESAIQPVSVSGVSILSGSYSPTRIIRKPNEIEETEVLKREIEMLRWELAQKNAAIEEASLATSMNNSQAQQKKKRKLRNPLRKFT